jgi:hypothetical protein
MPKAGKSGGSGDAEGDPYVCRANDAINIRLVSCADECDTENSFHPTYTHQVFFHEGELSENGK